VKLFCPSCGNALEFRYDDSFVRVCDACHSAIRRSDRGVDTLGQFADLAPASSGLVLQDRGKWQGQPFELSGRSVYAHPAGGSWEEWYLHFADGRWGWLSYAEGRWALTFPSARALELPAFEATQPGMPIDLGGGGDAVLSVAERNQATLVSAEGEIPFDVVPGRVGRFADLSDGGGRFATLDYGPPGSSEPPALYLGRQVRFDELGLPLRRPEAADFPGATLPAAAGERLACPHCGGSLSLRLPGSSLAVACPYCGSVLDCEGPLAILDRRSEPGLQAALPLGAQGTFDGVEFTITGRLRRESRDSSGAFRWDEYLLHHPAAGYRWLVCVNGHYSFVTELPAGTLARPGVVELDGRSFELFDSARPSVVEVFGEFYWKVRVGETVQARDYIAPPAMLSSEASESELHWSLGLYLTHAELRRAFRMPDLRDESHGVAAHQPFAHAHWRRVTLLLLLGLVLAAAVSNVRGGNRHVLETSFDLRPEQFAGAGATPTAVVFTEPFELQGGRNVNVRLTLPLQDSWAYVAGDLIDETSGQLRAFDTELSYYSGVDEGERWSEGSTAASHVLSAGSGGPHVLRLEVQRPGRGYGKLSIAVSEGVLVWRHLLFACLALGLPALGFLLYQFYFERARWSQSSHAPAHYASGGDDDDE
jgi:Domain of unknown function (DUF4178)